MKKNPFGINLFFILIALIAFPQVLPAQQYTISGQVTAEAGRGVDGVLIEFDDGEVTQYETTAGGGFYSHNVFPQWSGRVTPTSPCHTFTPVFVDIGPVTSNIEQNFTAVTSTYTISGTITDGASPIFGVLVSLSTGQFTLSGTDGSYSFTVMCGWTGTVTPTKVGWQFSPPSYVFEEPFYSNQTVNFTGTPSTSEYTISGQITDSRGSSGMDGVTITFYDGSTVHTETTSGGGYYSYNVPIYWTGTVTPNLDGFSFSPITAVVGPVTANTTQDFIGTTVTIFISGSIVDSNTNPVQGVNVTHSGGGSDITGPDGTYSLAVAFNWSGTVRPIKAGWTFQPINRSYTNVTTSMPSEHYVGYRLNQKYTISGIVRQPDGTGIPDVSLEFSNNGGTVTTDETGYYSNAVKHGWSGTVTPSLKGFTFVPTSRTYTNVTSEKIYQDYIYAVPGKEPEISLSKTKLNFAINTSGASTGSQSFMVNNGGGGSINWTVTADQGWIIYTPASGTDEGSVSVSVDASGLSTGQYTGIISVSDPDAVNSPQTVEVMLNVYSSTSPPFGDFATPLDGSTVRSSVPVTGWALDDIKVESVKIYRENNGSLVYIGDAVFVEGARPDVELMYPDYPMNYRAGWGYMMLTYFLPNGGNGTYTLHAIATDAEGNEVTLGTKIITCDNANAVKPFGAIDTPLQGGTAFGSNFRNQGWVLTPQPNAIPTDGSTINVFVDSVKLGHPTYNVYRPDIAALFPGYANSNGAMTYFDFDTTAYANGVHTIYWTATDDAGNTDGIGSRFFTIENIGSPEERAKSSIQQQPYFKFEDIRQLPRQTQVPITIKKGFRKDIEATAVPIDNSGITPIEINQLERIELQVSEGSLVMAGYMVVGEQLRRLPLGSTLDVETGTFYWLPTPEFYGHYHLVFVVQNQTGKINRKDIIVRIR
jgi:hypothetical protein